MQVISTLLPSPEIFAGVGTRVVRFPLIMMMTPCTYGLAVHKNNPIGHFALFPSAFGIRYLGAGSCAFVPHHSFPTPPPTHGDPEPHFLVSLWSPGLARKLREPVPCHAAVEAGPHLVTSLHTVRENNWPPLPFWCPVKPCFYQDFSVEIPADYQRICKMLYYLWMRESLACLLELTLKWGVTPEPFLGSGCSFPQTPAFLMLGGGGGYLRPTCLALHSLPCVGTSLGRPAHTTDHAERDL